MRFGAWLLTPLILALAWPASAEELEKKLKFSGFGTVGLVWNSTDQAGFVRDASQPEGATRTPDGRIDSRLGLQMDATLSSTLQGTLQVVSKYNYDGTFRPEFSWAFLGWTPVPEIQARAGRLGIEAFMNADSRDVGYSYLWVRPPVEVFGLIPITRMNGVDLTGTFSLGGQTTLRLKGFYGAIVSEQVPVSGYPNLDLSGDRVGGGIAEVQSGAWRGRMAYARFQFRKGFAPPVSELSTDLENLAALLGDPGLNQTATAVDPNGGVLQWYSAGLTYEEGPLQGQAMLNHLGSDRIFMPSSWTGFLSLGYRVGHATPYALWSRIDSRQQGLPYLGALPFLPNPLAAQVVADVALLTAVNEDTQSTAALGLRWDWRANVDCKFQVDRIRAQNGGMFNNSQPDWNGRATVVSATIDFVF
jgi:hypothetical protein